MALKGFGDGLLGLLVDEFTDIEGSDIDVCQCLLMLRESVDVLKTYSLKSPRWRMVSAAE
jgi:hypothetical protein